MLGVLSRATDRSIAPDIFKSVPNPCRSPRYSISSSQSRGGISASSQNRHVLSAFALRYILRLSSCRLTEGFIMPPLPHFAVGRNQTQHSPFAPSALPDFNAPTGHSAILSSPSLERLDHRFLALTRLAQRSLTLQPGNLLISPKLTLSVGFNRSITLHAATQARRLWLLPPRDFPH